MVTTTITPKEYKALIHRQEKIEQELVIVKKAILEADDVSIRSSFLRRLDRISHDLDLGKGRSFSSSKEAKKWIKNL